MKNSNNKSQYFIAKKKIYYGSVAFMALMGASTASFAMEEDRIDEMSRIRCLWNLEKKVFRTSALEMLGKKAVQEKDNPKLRLNYIKKLGQFLKENPEHNLNLDGWKPGNENEEGPLSKFYQETLNAMKNLPEASERGLQTLKLKIFYSQLPQNLTKVDTGKLQQDIRQSFNSVQRITGINNNHLRYLRLYYFEEMLDTQQLETLALSTPGTLLGGKISYKLGLNSIKNNKCLTAALSQGEHYYEKASKTTYSLVKYYLAELYNAVDSKEANLYLPESAYTYYVDTVKAGANKQGKSLAAYPLAAYKLAKFLEKGDNTFDLSADKEDALYWHREAAKHGHPYAQYELAKAMHREKEGTKLQSKEGMELLQQSAESGYSPAQFDLAQKYEEGYEDIIKKDSNLALFWYRKAADQDEEAAYYFLGNIYESKTDYKNALYFYNKSQNLRAHVRLGKMYLNGRGVSKSEQKAREKFTLAVEKFTQVLEKFNDELPKENTNIILEKEIQYIKKAYADGNYYLGLMKFKGQGSNEPDLKGAFNNFNIATEQNHQKAFFRLGIMNQFGIGMNQSFEKAKSFYEKSGTSAAYYHLGRLYQQGLIGKENAVKALEQWEEAAKSGHKEAAYKAGKIYLNAAVDEEDRVLAEKALHYLKQAADLNHTDAIYFLGLMQKKGIGCSQNSIEAKKYYEQAADAGHAHAQFKLGKFYKGSQYKTEAIKFYSLAAEQSHENAQSALCSLYQKDQDSKKASPYLNELDKAIPPTVLKLRKEAVAQDDRDSITWFEEKASKGNSSAQQYLGKLLETGKLCKIKVVWSSKELELQGIEGSIALYQRAAAQEKRFARRRLDDFKQAHLFEALGLKEDGIIMKKQNDRQEAVKKEIHLSILEEKK